MIYYKSKRKQDRLNEIFHILNCSKTPLSMRDVARQTGMCPSSHLMNLLYELVHEGDVEMIQEPYRQATRNSFKVKNY